MTKRPFPSAISPIVKGIVKNFGLERGIASLLLQVNWKEVVGPQIAAHTYPTEIRFTTLHLLVDSAVWMQELSFMKKEIIEKSNRLLEKQSIRDLHLRVGALPSPLVTPLAAGAAPVRDCTAEEAAWIEEQLQAIADPALKESVRCALRRHLIKEMGPVTGPAPGALTERPGH
ncbi:MAG: DUF721 domain-containing protein [Nitrospirae bacterium]|nr:DUF721 domain-containing protein [Candidatus Manganitrophaceae bacterium]